MLVEAVGYRFYRCNRSLPRLLAMVGDHELHSKEYYGDVFRGIHKKPKINNCAGLV